MAEATGLALAVFPLVVKGISVYVDGTRTIKDLWHWKLGLKCLVRELTMENVLFQNSCQNVLKGMCQDTDAVSLLRGEGWDDDFKAHLRECWGEQNSKVFTEGVERMGAILKEVEKDLGLGNNMTVPEDNSKQSRRRQWKQIKLVLQRDDCVKEISVINHQLERLATQLPAGIRKFSKQSAVATNYFRIRDLANNLHGVFRKRFQDSGLCPCNASHNANLQLPRIRSDTIDKSEDASKPVRFQVLFSFDIISPKGRSAPWNWRGLEFEPLSELLREPLSELLPEPTTQGIPQAIYPAEIKPSEEVRRTSRRIWNRITSFRTKSHKGKPAHLVSSPPSSAAIPPKVPPKKVRYNIPGDNSPTPAPRPMKITRTLSPREETKIIENLCLTIQQMEHHKPNRKSAMAISLGTLLGEGNMGWNCLWPSVMPAFPFDSTEAVSLDTLLKRGGINKEDRLRLGVQIALAMMQLHTTQWLGETWGKQDIFILRRAVERDQVSGDPTLVWEPILDRPFVRRKFASLHDTQPAPVEFSIADYDKSLFSLGIILIELALGKRIEDLRDSERTNYAQTQQSHIDPDYITALSWLGHVYSAEAGDYGDAVERCINGLRLPEPMSQDLNDPRYKNEVQTQIISLLERNLRIFLGR